MLSTMVTVMMMMMLFMMMMVVILLELIERATQSEEGQGVNPAQLQYASSPGVVMIKMMMMMVMSVMTVPELVYGTL